MAARPMAVAVLFETMVKAKRWRAGWTLVSVPNCFDVVWLESKTEERVTMAAGAALPAAKAEAEPQAAKVGAEPQAAKAEAEPQAAKAVVEPQAAKVEAECPCNPNGSRKTWELRPT